MGESVKPKGVRLKHKILQSPMAGCTDLAYRKIARRFGCQIAFTEMVKDRPVVQGNAKTLDMLRTADWDHPLGMQVVGKDPELMREAAKRLEGLGADVVDVNLGCPVPKVVNDGCGAALLKDPAQVGRILDAMVGAVRVPVTIKMRTGFEGGDDDRFLQIAKLAGECGVGAITVHGRTRKQMYTGFSNHEAIRAVKEVATVPVIGNGDLRSGADAKKMIEDTGCDGVMLARGALGNPWIYREVEQYLETGTVPPPPTVPEKAAVLREHFQALREIYGDKDAPFLIRRVIHWFVKGSSGSAALRDKGSHILTVEQFEELVREFEGAHYEQSMKDAKLRA
ncbi:MAG TPA: tRNA dihydrouridine synthase DusB [Planctomycetota bacterium]|nr:tRNA dihydrouridine synthase DusB [Planctomycetota bacterium]